MSGFCEIEFVGGAAFVPRIVMAKRSNAAFYSLNNMALCEIEP